jgi:uncharacterized protein (UPF0332 family)
MPDASDRLFNKAQTYLRSAAVLYELEDFDSCASRAYFAMFYAAQALLLHENGALPSQQGIRTSFINTFVDTGRLPSHAGNVLNQASEMQEMADYGHHFAVSQEQAERMLQEAEAFVNSLDRLAERL